MDITGFDEQIGFVPKINLPKINLKNPLPKNLPQTNFLKKVAQQAKPNIVQPTVKPSGGLFSAVKKAAQQARPNILQPKMQSAVPATSLFKKAMDKAKQTGKSIIVNTPTGVKKLTPKPAFNLVPTASKAPTNFFLKNTIQPIKKDEVKRFENTLQAMPATQQAKAIFNLPPTPAVVKNLNPTQRSFLKTDLPYQVISKNNSGQPTTQVIKNTPFKFNINIDQIQPPVDGGISNYYGK